MAVVRPDQNSGGGGGGGTVNSVTAADSSIVIGGTASDPTVSAKAYVDSHVLQSGTSFPGSPSAADLFYRTDRRILYEYNAVVTRWLTLDLKYVPFQGVSGFDASTTLPGSSFGRLPIFEDTYVESWITTSFVATTNNGSNFYTCQLQQGNGTVVASFDTSADGTSAFVIHNVAINTLYLAASLTALNNVVGQAKTGTPGAHYHGSILTLRAAG